MTRLAVRQVVDCPAGFAVMDDDCPIVEGLTQDQALHVLWNGHPPRVAARDGVNQANPLPEPSSDLGRYQARYKEWLAGAE